ncbi:MULTISPECIES: alpha/beta hydrolase-fold protein [unclassified Imperialibacter]|uniref:carboxylesterase family protein n=1 Tax=unclassified Imperialibacter TaxID=2629706 RepID=UPI0012590F36|nr:MULTISPECIES: alpha/beta hydrolase-fold protein [unclassified Imperialibacter]CAD5276694.1 Dienelactone hydrolase family protein [Imperialibacter sp. 75]CAD5294760.1 Dienelactone hydrolase family protein [Imperialibacter sp. 89]VVT12390.1 Dienelactone hydrolase family protein [Imperialibacter sp. EC-SDR9]
MNAFPINRDFYFFGSFLIGLYIVANTLQAGVQMWVGYQMFWLPSFGSWLLVTCAIYLLPSLFLLKYYHQNQYRLAFLGTIASSIMVLLQVIVLTAILRARQLQDFYNPVLYLLLFAGLVHAAGLLTSDARKKPLLKTIGLGLGIVNVILLISLTWMLLSGNNSSTGIFVQKLAEWTTIAGGLVWALFIRQFMGERSLLKEEQVSTESRKSIADIYAFFSFMGVFFILLFGFMIVKQGYYNTHATPAARKMANPYEFRSYSSSKGETLQYRFLKPLDYEPGKKFPMVVCLHGGAGWGTDNTRQFDGSLAAQMLSDYTSREKYQAFLFVPQCPPMHSWGGIPAYKSIDSLVFEAMAALEREFAIDEKRRYVMGSSLGGYGTWHFISTRPEMFAAAIPISGEGDPDFAKEIVDVPVWAFHGRTDINVPVSGSQHIIQAVKNAGGSPRYTEYPDRGHDIWKQVRETPDLMDWMFAQAKE